MVTKSFKVTSISNSMDGTEDDAIWQVSSESEDYSGSDEEVSTDE
jgi:hypothetical protein